MSLLNPLTIRKKGVRAKAIMALAVVCFFWGTTWIASKEGVRHMPPLQMAGMRQTLGGLCYVSYFIITGARWPNQQQWRSILVLGFLNFLIANGLSTWGVKYISAGLGSIIGAIFPLWLVVIGLFSPKKNIPIGAIFGLLIGFSGVCVIFYQHLQDFWNEEFRIGIFVSILATWGWAFGTIYTKKHAANFNPYFSIGLQMLTSGITMLSIANISGETIAFNKSPWQSWLSIAHLVVFGSVISFMAYLYALQNLSTEQASLYAYINPIVAVALGALLFSEKVSLFIVMGGLVALLGVYIVNKAYKVSATANPETEGI
jgi:drug/metabolite transporter (DMT)-like permease